MMPSQPELEQTPGKSDWESAVVELLDLRLLASQSVGTLLATSRQLRNHVHDNSTSLELRKRVDVDLLVRQRWPRLAKLALRKSGWPMAAAMAQGSWHALHSLDLRRGGLDLLDMQHLAKSMLPQLTRLGLGECGAGPGMCKALVNGHWPHLAVLKLRGNSLGPADVQDLVQGHLPSLANLDLSGNSFGKKALRWDSCNWPHLTKLTVSQCSLGVSDIESLVRAHWPLLACLDVGDNRLDHTYLRSLAQGHWPELLGLRLAYNDNSAAEDLHQANWTSLGMLDLGAADLAPRIPLQAVYALLQVFGQSLHTLNVHCEVVSVTATVAKQQSWPCKTSLCMDAIASASVLQNLAVGHWPIKWLSLQRLDYSVTTPPAIAQLFQIDLSRMESLSLGGFFFGMYNRDPAFRFQHGEWPALKHLDLSFCDLQDDFLVQLTSGQWPLLQKLDLSCNSLTLQGVAQLVAGHWPNLSVLDLQYNHFDMYSESNLV